MCTVAQGSGEGGSGSGNQGTGALVWLCRCGSGCAWKVRARLLEAQVAAAGGSRFGRKLV